MPMIYPSMLLTIIWQKMYVCQKQQFVDSEWFLMASNIRVYCRHRQNDFQLQGFIVMQTLRYSIETTVLEPVLPTYIFKSEFIVILVYF